MSMKSILALAALAAFAAPHADGAQLKLLVGGAMSEPFREVGADFQKKTGHMLSFTIDTTGALQNKLRAGEKADLILVSSPGMDTLQKEKRIVPGTRVDLGRAVIGVSVRAGAQAPDISSVDAFKKALLSARSVSYVDPKAGGTSGTYMAGLLQRLGIADEVNKKVVFRNQGSAVADAVAKGEAEIGITFTSEMMPNKGAKVIGLLPDAIQSATVYAAAIPVGADNADAARAFLQEFNSSAAEAAIRKAGLEPVAH
jgi:molybdate transport system substrate-binding protein